MLTTNLVYIILIALLAIGIAYFQYFFKAKRKDKKTFLFAFLRFLSVFLLGLLLVNPKFSQISYETIKPKLFITIDNSQSVSFLKQEEKVLQFVEGIQSSQLNQDFDVSYYSFDRNIHALDSLTFQEKQTQISTLFTTLKNVTTESNAAAIIVTDGNQTLGPDYVVQAATYKAPIFPVIIGDTIPKTDIKISHVQNNKYAYLGNDFPIEITVQYQGEITTTQTLNILLGEKIVASKKLDFSKDNTHQVVSLLLPASAKGITTYQARISTLENEENLKNNTRKFTVDIIDQQTKVAIISSISHPDVGTLNKAIESNEQRKVTIIAPEKVSEIESYQLLIIYQPNSSFSNVFSQIEKTQKNHWIITGMNTDWDFLNTHQDYYSFTGLTQQQDYLATYNPDFLFFQTPNIDFNIFPPLQSEYGSLTYNVNAQPLLYQKIQNQVTAEPLLSCFEVGKQRGALLLGEGIWKWRAQAYRNSYSFEEFDTYISNVVQFLAHSNTTERLIVNSENLYNYGDLRLEAQYFDKNYILDKTKELFIDLEELNTKSKYKYSFIASPLGYHVNLENLPPGNYNYSVHVKGESLYKKGKFEILDFSVEEQFLNPNVTKLQAIATNSKKKLYSLSENSRLEKDLLQQKELKTIQRQISRKSPLIKWQYLLFLIITVLGLEWFLRKFNGLI